MKAGFYEYSGLAFFSKAMYACDLSTESDNPFVSLVHMYRASRPVLSQFKAPKDGYPRILCSLRTSFDGL